MLSKLFMNAIIIETLEFHKGEHNLKCPESERLTKFFLAHPFFINNFSYN